MVLTARTLGECCSESAVQLLAQLDREYGKDTLGSQYTKLSTVMMTAKAIVAPYKSSKQLTIKPAMEFLLQGMLVALRRNECDATFFTLERLGVSRKEAMGKATWVETTLTKWVSLHHICTLVGSCTQLEAIKWRQTILPVFGEPLKWHSEFPLATTNSGEDESQVPPDGTDDKNADEEMMEDIAAG